MGKVDEYFVYNLGEPIIPLKTVNIYMYLVVNGQCWILC